MIKALFCIFSVVIGIYALFFGTQSLENIQWHVDSTAVQYTEPPFIARKENEGKDFGSHLTFEKEPIEIHCYSYEDFSDTVEQYRKDQELNIEVNKTNSIREGIVASAVAIGDGIRISYKPSLLIILNGYGPEELILEMEREGDQRFLRLLLPNAQYSRTTAKTFRQMDLPYALNHFGLSKGEVVEALQQAYCPRYTLDVSRPSTTFGSDLSADELQLRMKGIIYDSLIESYENGWEMVIFDASIKTLKALQSVLDEMMPLPVQLLSYPLWRDAE